MAMAMAMAMMGGPAPPPSWISLWPEREHPGMRVVAPAVACPPMHRRAAMVVFRGGAFRIHNGSGKDCAEFFAERGLLAFEVEYHTAEGPGPCATGTGAFPRPIHDAARAVRLIRSRAAEFGVDPNRIGVAGFSAGGHLAAILCGPELPCQEGDEEDLADFSFRPDVCVLSYPVISLMPELRGPRNLSNSAENLLGAEAEDEAQLTALSAERRVSRGHPPTFLWHTRADEVVPVAHSEEYANAMTENGVPHKLLLFEEGPHAMGLALEGEHANDWSAQMLAWLGPWCEPRFAAPIEKL